MPPDIIVDRHQNLMPQNQSKSTQPVPSEATQSTKEREKWNVSTEKSKQSEEIKTSFDDPMYANIRK